MTFCIKKFLEGLEFEICVGSPLLHRARWAVVPAPDPSHRTKESIREQKVHLCLCTHLFNVDCNASHWLLVKLLQRTNWWGRRLLGIGWKIYTAVSLIIISYTDSNFIFEFRCFTNHRQKCPFAYALFVHIMAGLH